MFEVIFLAIVAAIVYGIVALARRRRQFGEVDTGIGTVRRLYFYTVTFVALMMAASGVTEIAHYILDELASSSLVEPSRIRLATGLSLTIVGLPLWAVHWRLITKQVREIPVETRSIVRKAYLYLVLAVAAGIVIGTAVTVLQWLMDNRSFSGYSAAAVVVWGGVWAFYWRLEAEEGQPTPDTRAVRRLYLYLVAAVTLITAAIGIGMLTAGILREAYDAIASTEALNRPGLWSSPAKIALSLVLVPGAVWAAHWLYFARRDYESTLRQLYVYGVVLGGVVTVLTAVGIIIGDALIWTIGVPDQESAADHFNFLPAALASLIVAGGILAYHAYAAREEAEAATPASKGARSTYPYLLALVGLVPVAAAIVAVVATAIDILAGDDGSSLVGADQWRNAIAISITLGLLGTPIWGYYWASIQRRVSAGGAEARMGLARRLFIFAVLGAGMIALLISVSVFLFVFLRELLDGDLSTVLPDTRYGIGAIVAAAVFVPYYWMVYRADRQATAELEGTVEEPRVRKAVTVLVNEAATAFVGELEAVLGYRVSPLNWADPDASLPEVSEDELQGLAQRISDASGANVLLVPEGTTMRVLSYR